jgi:hypothetical protein
MESLMGDRARFATSIPKKITAPVEVDTRLWTFRFVDGFPDTVEKVFDNLDSQRGVEAMMVAMPERLRAWPASADG